MGRKLTSRMSVKANRLVPEVSISVPSRSQRTASGFGVVTRPPMAKGEVGALDTLGVVVASTSIWNRGWAKIEAKKGREKS